MVIACWPAVRPPSFDLVDSVFLGKSVFVGFEFFQHKFVVIAEGERHESPWVVVEMPIVVPPPEAMQPQSKPEQPYNPAFQVRLAVDLDQIVTVS
jgi:hypothetical protein